MTTLIIGLAAVLFATVIVQLIRGGQRYHWPPAHEDALSRLAEDRERLVPGTTPWPDLTGPPGPFTWCANPPCEPEDGWTCKACRPGLVSRTGRHAAVWQGSLDNQPADVILAVVTDARNRRRS